MSFTRVVYTADWNDRDRFPTYQPDEDQVREDLQELPNQIKNQTNRLMTELEAGSASASIGAKDADGNDTTVQDALDGLAEAKVRLFTLSGVSDLETAQAAYDFLQSGGLPILKFATGVSRFYVYDRRATEGEKDYFYFCGTDDLSGPSGDGDEMFYQDCRALVVEDGTVTQVQPNMHVVSRYLSTYGLTEQSTAFMPQYPGQPATKKYVDDSVARIHGTFNATYGETTYEEITEAINAGLLPCVTAEIAFDASNYITATLIYHREVSLSGGYLAYEFSCYYQDSFRGAGYLYVRCSNMGNTWYNGFESIRSDEQFVKWAEYGETTYEQIEEWVDAGDDVCVLYNSRIYRIAAILGETTTRIARFVVIDNATEYQLMAAAYSEGAATTWSAGNVKYETV